jgi:adenine C2-methylase RlmN of 23S rRNA A2503 and tRNA A37
LRARRRGRKKCVVIVEIDMSETATGTATDDADVPVTLNLSRAMLDYLQQQALARDVKVADVLRDAIGSDKFFRENAKTGSVLLKDGNRASVVNFTR